MVDASKTRYGRVDAIALARTAKRVISGRGKNIRTFDMCKSPPDDATIAAAILGPSGNLKAPTVRIGDTLIVGFDEATYKEFFG